MYIYAAKRIHTNTLEYDDYDLKQSLENTIIQINEGNNNSMT